MSEEEIILSRDFLLGMTEELQALRAWKAKAMPFLEEVYESRKEAHEVHGIYGEAEKYFMTEDEFMAEAEELEQDVTTLTELLGGDDEQG